MITIREHEKINNESLEGIDLTSLRARINYDTSKFVTSSVNLIRYVFDPNPNSYKDGFYSYYRIGAEWIDKENKRSIVVVPKIDKIDFLEMFMTCLQDNESADNFSAIYNIDFEGEPIKSATLSSILSPLLVVQFLIVIDKIAHKGLCKDYISKEDTLSKVKGRINIRLTERNVLTGHHGRIHCKFDEYSVDSPENRLLKKALRIARDMISNMVDNKAYIKLSGICNHCLSTFENVSDIVSEKLPIVKYNKLYPEYSEAIRIAKIILHWQDIAISNKDNSSFHIVPIFQIDMALLFEHYSLAILRKIFGFSSVKYQTKGYRGRYITDFLIQKNNLKLIIDAKYVDIEDRVVAKPEYIKQLSGYSRDTVILKAMGYDISDDDSIPVIPCLIAYPAITKSNSSLAEIFSHPIKHTLKFYKYPIHIPIMS